MRSPPLPVKNGIINVATTEHHCHFPTALPHLSFAKHPMPSKCSWKLERNIWWHRVQLLWSCQATSRHFHPLNGSNCFHENTNNERVGFWTKLFQSLLVLQKWDLLHLQRLRTPLEHPRRTTMGQRSLNARQWFSSRDAPGFWQLCPNSTRSRRVWEEAYGIRDLETSGEIISIWKRLVKVRMPCACFGLFENDNKWNINGWVDLQSAQIYLEDHPNKSVHPELQIC